MRHLLKRRYLGDELEKIMFVHHTHIILLFMGLMMRPFESEIKISSFLITLIFHIIFCKYYRRTVRMLYYTFWTFSIAVFFYLIFQIFINGPNARFFYCLSLVFLFVQWFFLSSPIFFPRIRWWEYDVRYRGDLPIFVANYFSRDNFHEGRLTDLRHSAACILLFEDLEVKEKILCRCEYEGRPWDFTGTIVSKREYSYGRGITYGVKFILTAPEVDSYQNFQSVWNGHRRRKIKAKQEVKNLETRDSEDDAGDINGE